MFCNGCGREIRQKQDILLEDVFCGRKAWGYFSKKDTQFHSFHLCEECYDHVIKQFVIQPEITEMTEL